MFDRRVWFLVAGSWLAAAGAVAQPVPFQGGEVLSFDAPQVVGPPLKLKGYLWKPTTPPKGAVVLMHGSGGWSAPREGHYGEALSKAGYAVLAIDSFGARGLTDTTEQQANLPTLYMTKDAFAGRRQLIALGYPPEKLAVMGFSKGGGVALHAADRNFLPEEQDRFAVGIPVYPGCNVRLREPKLANKLFFALAEKDNYTGTKICQDIAEDYRSRGGDIVVKVYPGALHSFDNDPAIGRETYLARAHSYRDCMVYLEPDGAYTYAGKRYQDGDLSIYRDMARTCVKMGVSIGANAQQKAAFTADVIQYLDQTLAP
ncbi:MAG: dienelactone hydrolase family protein [Hydrogenophaga sp.]|nr:dienelactone hydrolase family protein [Hydrogenophaga sp.]